MQDMLGTLWRLVSASLLCGALYYGNIDNSGIDSASVQYVDQKFDLEQFDAWQEQNVGKNESALVRAKTRINFANNRLESWIVPGVNSQVFYDLKDYGLFIIQTCKFDEKIVELTWEEQSSDDIRVLCNVGTSKDKKHKILRTITMIDDNNMGIEYKIMPSVLSAPSEQEQVSESRTDTVQEQKFSVSCVVVYDPANCKKTILKRNFGTWLYTVFAGFVIGKDCVINRAMPEKMAFDDCQFGGISTGDMFLGAVNPNKRLNFKYQSAGEQKCLLMDHKPMMVKSRVANKEQIKFNLIFCPEEYYTLRKYGDFFHIPCFVSIIDFGWFRIFTKPLVRFLSSLSLHIWNGAIGIGLAIILITLFIKFIGSIVLREYNLSMNMSNISYDPQFAMVVQKHKMQLLWNFISKIGNFVLLISIFKVISLSVPLMTNVPFLWCGDLAESDNWLLLNLGGYLPFHVPGFLNFGLFPILLTIVSYFNGMTQAQISQNAYARKMQLYSSLILLVILQNLSVGLLLSLFLSELLTMLESFINAKFLQSSSN